MRMLDKVFKDHNEVMFRDESMGIVVNGGIHLVSKYTHLKKGNFDGNLQFKSQTSKDYDIMKVVNPFTGEVLFERDGVDWDNLPVDTKVLVSNDSEHWGRAHFKSRVEVSYGYVYETWVSGTTEFTSQGYFSKWKYCKLYE